MQFTIANTKVYNSIVSCSNCFYVLTSDCPAHPTKDQKKGHFTLRED